MPSSTSHITSLTADYDAIERAIRETSRGRWFLACYLERNRSAETKMLLNAIGKLETAMRENGQIMADTGPFEALMTVRDAIDRARDDIAQLPSSDPRVTSLPVRRFDFESASSTMAAELEEIRDAAASIHSAAYAMHAAGVFQSVARQIVERANAIETACVAQEASLARTSRMAQLVSEIESELMSAFDGDEETFPCHFYGGSSEFDHVRSGSTDERAIPNELVEEISAALSECTDDDYYGPEQA